MGYPGNANPLGLTIGGEACCIAPRFTTALDSAATISNGSSPVTGHRPALRLGSTSCAEELRQIRGGSAGCVGRLWFQPLHASIRPPFDLSPRSLQAHSARDPCSRSRPHPILLAIAWERRRCFNLPPRHEMGDLPSDSHRATNCGSGIWSVLRSMQCLLPLQSPRVASATRGEHPDEHFLGLPLDTGHLLCF